MDHKIEKLVSMANQIAKNHTHLDGAQASDIIAQHLRKFWHKAMLSSIISYYKDGGDQLCDVSKGAVKILAEMPAR